jgi:hypothetical protein
MPTPISVEVLGDMSPRMRARLPLLEPMVIDYEARGGAGVARLAQGRGAFRI